MLNTVHKPSKKFLNAIERQTGETIQSLRFTTIAKRRELTEKKLGRPLEFCTGATFSGEIRKLTVLERLKNLLGITKFYKDFE